MDDKPGYLRSTIAADLKRRDKADTGSAKPWVPAGAGTRGLSGESRGEGVSHNIVGQKRAEAREALLADKGSMETTVFNGLPRPSAEARFKGIVPRGGRPTLESGSGGGRVYLSLDSPGMGSPDARDARMDRHEVGEQYRHSYHRQQVEKERNVDAIPATSHTEVSLRKARAVMRHAIPQEGARAYPDYRSRDQFSDAHKYKSSVGMTRDGFDALRETAVPGSERLATASRAGRAMLARSYGPGTVVHPSELRSPSETMLRRAGAGKPPSGHGGRGRG